jgi:two-component system sensor histidine kinase RegB
MTEQPSPLPGPPARAAVPDGSGTLVPSSLHLTQTGVRVRTLIALRWIAIVGQLATLGIVGGYLDYPLLLGPALAAVGASIVLNLGLNLAYPANTYLSGRQAGLQLAFDLLQLAVLLYLTGGLENPFSVLILVPVTISATLLSQRSTFGLIGLAIACVTILALWSHPLPWEGRGPDWPPTYRFGVWSALIIGMGFLSAYAWQVSAEARRRQQALVATQAALARAQQLSATGALAAAAAHELGTPLNTITLVARELRDQLGNDPDFGADIQLLDEQVARCRDILTSIAGRTEAEQHFAVVSLEALVREVMRHHESSAKSLIFEVDKTVGAWPIARSPELLHALENLLANAERHARAIVRLKLWKARDGATLSIVDDGPGFPPELLPRLGEPYLARVTGRTHGLGLGIFIAITLLERVGLSASFDNDRQRGARVDIRIPPPAAGLQESMS